MQSSKSKLEEWTAFQGEASIPQANLQQDHQVPHFHPYYIEKEAESVPEKKMP